MSGHEDGGERHAPAADKPDAAEVRELLTQGNRRFREGRPRHPHADESRRRLAANADQGAHAVATVLACSDSRVPVELIFDAGVMDLFVVRVAGNVVTPATLASLEYGVLHVNTPLLVVLGHSGCGAVTAALGMERGEAPPAEFHVTNLLECISPAVRGALEGVPPAGPESLLDRAIELNVRRAMSQILCMSPPLDRAAGQGRFQLAGALYELGDGEVKWL